MHTVHNIFEVKKEKNVSVDKTICGKKKIGIPGFNLV